VELSIDFVIDIDIFQILLEVINKQKGSRTLTSIWSTTPWLKVQEMLSEMFNVYPTSLHAQYRLSTENKSALPFDLTSQSELTMMYDLLQPLIVPPLLANGKRSTRKMKDVKVQVFNAGDAQLAADGKASIRHFHSFFYIMTLTQILR
jgi:hypothetical protein